MYAVIFKAEINKLDEQYFETASMLRELAIKEYGCVEFISSAEGSQEIAISYWPTEQSIRAWNCDSVHKKAQALGKSKWYKSYKIQVVEIQREYESTT